MKPYLKKLIPLVGVVCMSTSAIFIRVNTAPSLVLALYRMALSSLLMLPFVIIRHPAELREGLKLKNLKHYVLSGLCFGTNILSYIEAVKNTSIAAAAMLGCSEVFFVALCAWLFWHEKISAKGWIGIIVAFVGCVLLAVAQGLGDIGNVRGMLYAVVSALSIGLFTLLGKRYRNDVPNSVYTLIVFVSAGVMMLLVCLLKRLPLSGYGKDCWLSALGLTMACTLLGHSLLTWGLRYDKASYISSLKLLMPCLSALLGWMLLGEAPKLSVLACCAVIIAGILFYLRNEPGTDREKSR